MSSHQQEQTQILQTCHKINQILDIPQQSFSIEALTHVQWYLTVLEAIYPYLKPKFSEIKKVNNEALAIDKLLYLLTQQQIIQEDFLEIKGHDIVQGDLESVYYVVQLLNALIERSDDGDTNRRDEDETREGESKNLGSVSYDHRGSNSSNDLEKFGRSSNQSPLTENLPQEKQTSQKRGVKSYKNESELFKNGLKSFDSQEQGSHQQQRHSVLGIKNQFQDEDDDEEEHLKKKSNKQENSGNLNKKKQSPSINKKKPPSSANRQNQAESYNIYNNFQQPHIKQNQQPFKITQQNQPQIKKFPSSSEEEVQFYQKKQKLFSQPYKNKEQKSSSQEQDDNEYFINPTVKKYKSDQKLQKVSDSKKSTTKKNTQKKQIQPLHVAGNSRKLVSHPVIKKQYRKASNPQAEKLTNQIKAKASLIIRKKKKPLPTSLINPGAAEMQRKRKQLNLKLENFKKHTGFLNKRFIKANSNLMNTNAGLEKVLNWRQGQLKKEKQDFQKAMEAKLLSQRQAYIKKINSLLIKLQKEKQLQQQHLYKEQLTHENQQAAKRLNSIQQWYRDRIQILKEKHVDSHNQRNLMHTGHKQILKQIEKQLKRQNQKQIMAMTMKYKRQQAQIEDDLEQLKREIIMVYKRN